MIYLLWCSKLAKNFKSFLVSFKFISVFSKDWEDYSKDGCSSCSKTKTKLQMSQTFLIKWKMFLSLETSTKLFKMNFCNAWWLKMQNLLLPSRYRTLMCLIFSFKLTSARASVEIIFCHFKFTFLSKCVDRVNNAP